MRIKLSERMQELRKRQNKTQKEIAEYLGITLRTYQYYEGGGHRPDLETVVALADLFDVTVDYLIGRTDEPGCGKDRG